MEKWQTIIILVVIAIGFSGLSFFGSQNKDTSNPKDIPPLFNPEQSQVTMVAEGVNIKISQLLPSIFIEAETESLEIQSIAEELYALDGVKLVNNPVLAMETENYLTFSATIAFESGYNASSILKEIQETSLSLVGPVRGQTFAVVELPKQIELKMPNDENVSRVHEFEETMANALIYSLDKKSGDSITADIAVVLAGDKALQIAVEEQVPEPEFDLSEIEDALADTSDETDANALDENSE